MIDPTDLDRRLADHRTRIDDVNRDAWTRAAAAATRVTRTRAIPTVIASIRQRMGATVVHAGERLQGTTVRHAADPWGALIDTQPRHIATNIDPEARP